MSNEKTETRGYFDELIGMTDDEVKQKGAKLGRRTVKRYFASAHDQMLSDKMGFEKSINNTYAHLRTSQTLTQSQVQYVVDNLVNLHKVDLTLAILRKEYLHLFGEELPTE